MIIETTDLPVPGPELVMKFEGLLRAYGSIHNRHAGGTPQAERQLADLLAQSRDIYRQDVLTTGYPLEQCRAEMLRVLNRIYAGSCPETMARLAERWSDAMFTVEEMQAWMVTGIMSSGQAARLRLRGVSVTHVFLALDLPHPCRCGLKTFRAAIHGGTVMGERRRCPAYADDLMKTCLALGSSAYE